MRAAALFSALSLVLAGCGRSPLVDGDAGLASRLPPDWSQRPPPDLRRRPERSIERPLFPDLAIVSLGGSYAGGALKLVARVCNVGSQGTNTLFTLHFYLDRKPAPGAKGDAYQLLYGLDAGSCREESVLLGAAKVDHSVWAQVDPENAVAESNEGNNVYGPIAVKAGGDAVDLVVSSFSAYTSPSLSTVYYYLTVCNSGAGVSSPTAVEVYYSRPTAPGPADVGNQSKSVPSLWAGGCFALSLSTYLSPGSYQSWAYVDRQDLVAEANESNNVKGPQLVVVGPGSSADLAVAALTATVGSGGQVSYKATVCNKGTGSSGSTQLELYYNRASAPTMMVWGDVSLALSGLAAGACATLAHTKQLAAGSYSSWAWVDRANLILEANESNNLYGPLAFKVSSGALPDLYVAKLDAKIAGNAVSYSIVVCNKGSASSSSCYLGVYYNLAAPPTASSKADGSIYLGPLGLGGACTTTQWAATLAPGSYSSWALIDATGMVAESDEGNNASGPLAVSVAGATQCETICTSLMTPCNLLPQAQYDYCVATCKGQSQQQVDCALKALAQQLCFDAVGCLFS
jgi:subtilase family serine protease